MRLEQLQKRRNNNEKHGIKDNEKTDNKKKISRISSFRENLTSLDYILWGYVTSRANENNENSAIKGWDCGEIGCI